MMTRRFPTVRALATLAVLATMNACGHGHDDDGHGHDQEVITTVTLTFTPVGSGAPVVASFDDPDGPGGNPPVIGAVTLAQGTTYNLALAFLNKLETPAEDITAEIAAEKDEHQIFFTGDAVEGPGTSTTGNAVKHAYGDVDSKGLPVGLANTVVAQAAGAGKLRVTLQHLPPINGAAIKTATLAQAVSTSGLGALPGDADASVEFPLTVVALP